MNKNNLKNILNYINKYADLPAGMSGSGAAPTPPAGGPKPSGSYTTSSNDIAKMQKAIQEFANAATKYNEIPVGKDDKGKPKYIISPDDKRRDFNDFLAEQFMANADIHGDEYTPDVSATTLESKLPTDIVQLNNVINGLKRIGSSANEMKMDGIWDFRTNNAVRNTYAFASALVTAYEALGGLAANDPNVFTRSDLAQLKNSMPKERDPKEAKIDPKQLNEYAKNITPIVNRLTNFYKLYSKKTMDHAAYKNYINQSSPLYTFTPGGTNPYKADPSDPDQQKIMDNPKTFIMPHLTLTGKDGKLFKLDNKISLESFQSTAGIATLMVQHLGYSASEVNNPKLLTQVVRSILSEVSKFIDTNSKQLPPRPPPPPKVTPYNPKLLAPTP